MALPTCHRDLPAPTNGEAWASDFVRMEREARWHKQVLCNHVELLMVRCSIKNLLFMRNLTC